MTGGEIEELPHTADIGFRVSAPSLPDLFRLAADGLASALGASPEVEGESPDAGERGSVSLRRDGLERLLVAWLRELLRGARTERGVPRIESLEVTREEDGVRLEAALRWLPWGDRGPEREIKGVTYHGLEVRREGGRWHATVVLDV